MRPSVLLLVLAVGASLAEERITYHGYYAISVTAVTGQQTQILRYLYETFRDQLVFMKPPETVNHELEIVVAPELIARITQTLTNVGLRVHIISTDVGREFDAVMAENEAIRTRAAQEMRLLSNGRTTVAHTFYRSIDQINALLASWADNPAFAGLISLRPLPRHSESDGRLIYYVEVGTAGHNKPVIFIEGTAHAREWIVAGSLLYTVDSMLNGYVNGDAQARSALDKYTFVVIPVVNPDGYAFSWSTDRLWRKTRRYISDKCYGVDLNRNFDVHFGGVGASSNCRDLIYQGAYAFSEAESQNIQLLFHALKPRVVSFLSVHSYGQMLIYPWGYVNSNVDPNPPSNLDQLIAVGRLMQTALQSNGMVYSLGTTYSELGYAVSGGAEDWALQDKPGIYAYCLELRPRTHSQGDFDIPASHIVPNGQEFLRSLYALAENI